MGYDFLIVRSGTAGASAACELTARGPVLLLEAEGATGYHATRRSAALFPRTYGGSAVRHDTAASPAFFRTPLKGFCPTPLLTPRGAVTVAQDAGATDLDAPLAQSEPGEEAVPINSDAACAMVPFLRPNRVKYAVCEANGADIDVAPLQLSYLSGARGRGAKVSTKQAVTPMTRKATGWTVQSVRCSFSAVYGINAAGAWPDDMDIAVLADWIERETSLKVQNIRHGRAGLRSFVSDEAPVVGFVPEVPHFFRRAGQGGSGILTAPALAALTADLICDWKAGTASAGFTDEVAPRRLH